MTYSEREREFMFAKKFAKNRSYHFVCTHYLVKIEKTLYTLAVVHNRGQFISDCNSCQILINFNNFCSVVTGSICKITHSSTASCLRRHQSVTVSLRRFQTVFVFPCCQQVVCVHVLGDVGWALCMQHSFTVRTIQKFLTF